MLFFFRKFLYFSVLNINGNLVQIATSAPTTTAAVAQPAVTSPTQTVVPQIATASGNQLTMANGNLVMVRNSSDVRNDIKNDIRMLLI